MRTRYIARCLALLGLCSGLLTQQVRAEEILVEIPAGTSLFCPPDRVDGRLDAGLGRSLTGLVDRIQVREPGATNVVSLVPGVEHPWVDGQGQPYTRELEPGQGFIVRRDKPDPVRFACTVTAARLPVNIRDGQQIVGAPGGKPLALATAFTDPVQGAPVESFDETQADEMALLNPDGSWRRLLRLPGGIWFDTKTGTNTTLVLAPGQAMYYQRQPGHGPLQVNW